MSYKISKKITMKILQVYCNKITKKKINKNDNLFKLLDSLEIMTLLSSVEKNFKIKLNIIKILNREKLDIEHLYSNLN
jgi:acyl carrier protein